MSAKASATKKAEEVVSVPVFEVDHFFSIEQPPLGGKQDAPVKSCLKCGAQTTPVWRKGPLGDKTLCNACGVRWIKMSNRGRRRRPTGVYSSIDSGHKKHKTTPPCSKL